MGLTITTAAAILAFNALAASAQTWSCDCNGFEAPVWDDCATIMETLDNPPLPYKAGSDQLPCTFVTPPNGIDPDSLNCVVTYCKRGGVAEGEDIQSSDIKINYSTVTSTCKAQTGSPGGECGPEIPVDNNNKVVVQAKANPNYSAGARRRAVAADPLEPVISETLVHAQPPKTNNKREHARDFPHGVSKRQSPPEDDETFQLFVTSENVENPNGGRIEVFGPSPSGSTYTVSSSRSETNSVSSSVSASASLFEIFELSVSIEVGYEETISESEGYSVPVDCPSGQRGIIYWVPLYTLYQGLYQPSGTQVEWYVANGGTQTSYVLQCIGQ